MIDGWGGINVAGIQAGLEELQIPESIRPIIFKKLMILARGLMPRPPEESDG
jgi:hypothetical protein